MYTAASILAAIDARRAELGAALGRTITYAEVGDAVELHPAIFSRLRRADATIPSPESIAKLAAWVGSDEALHCAPCDQSDGDEEYDEVEVEAEDVQLPARTSTVYAIRAVSGKLSDSEDPETQAAVTRARELLEEGAVGVSVLLDIHPDDAAILGEAEKKAQADGWEKPFEDYLPSPDWTPRQRIRHTAIVDTPAYSDARLTVAADGTLSGEITYEGIYTGDVRYAAAPEAIVLEDSHVPSPIIWDREDGDHSGMTIGYIDAFERVELEGEVSGRPVLDDEAITASMKPLEFPAAYFARTVPAKAEPITISQPDAKGYRVISGLAAPKGVCHRGSMSCFTLPSMDEKDLDHFHTGALLRLDNGQDIRVGALTMYGGHIDPDLYKSGVPASKVGNHRDNANQVLALVRAFPTRFGLWVNGVIPPGASEGDIAKALACAPSVELWPVGRGKKALVGIHLVPRPAWPVVASMGSAEFIADDDLVQLAEPEPDDEVTEAVAEVMEFDLNEHLAPMVAKIESLAAVLADIHGKVDAVLALTPVPDDLIPEE